MSPDIEWRVGEEAEQETIVKIAPARRSQRSLWAVFIAIGLGASLGLLYRSIPEPPAQPIGSTLIPSVIEAPLSPRPTPASLAVAIERDALRLSASAGEPWQPITFEDTAAAPPEYAAWYAALHNAYGDWGPPAYGTLYTVFETGTLASGVTWVKLGQFRHNDFYRQTRFYRLEDGRWVWTLPDRLFWVGATAAVKTGDAGTIGPITIGHPIEDAPVIGVVFDRFTRAYLNLCESLNCPARVDRTRLWTPGLTLTIMIKPGLMQPAVQERRGTLVIDLPSPRVVGYYEDANAIGDPYVSMAYDTLIDPVVRLASGDYARWETDRGGELFLQAIATWQRARLLNRFFLLELFYRPQLLPPSRARLPSGQPISLRQRYADRLRGEKQVPLNSLWDWASTRQGFGLLEHIAVQEAEAIVIYIEEEYGPDGVVRFLNALGRAHSLAEAISAALPVSFGEFNRQWLRWIAGE